MGLLLSSVKGSDCLLEASFAQAKGKRGKEHSHTEVDVTRVNPAILDVRALGNTRKPEGLRALRCLEQDAGS